MALLRPIGEFIYNDGIDKFDVFSDNTLFQSSRKGICCTRSRTKAKCSISQIKNLLADISPQILGNAALNKMADETQMESAFSAIMEWQREGNSLKSEMTSFIKNHFQSGTTVEIKNKQTIEDALEIISDWKIAKNKLRPGMGDFLKTYLATYPKGEFRQAAKDLLNDNQVPSPDKIDRLTEEFAGAKYRIHFKGTKETFNIFANTLPKCYAGGKPSPRWDYFIRAVSMESLEPGQRFKVNESLRILFGNSNFEFFESNGNFKYPIPISRKNQTYEKTNTFLKNNNDDLIVENEDF